MTVQRWRACWILSVFFALTFLAVRIAGLPKLSTRPPVSLALPNVVGEWRGKDLLFCPNEECDLQYGGQTDSVTCRSCGQPLVPISNAERKRLPKDTIIVRKAYTRNTTEGLTVTVVFSGQDRSGIHPPQWCLPGQGYSILSQRIIRVDLQDRSSLKVALLETDRSGSAQDRDGSTARILFAYWFVGGTHETPSRFRQVFWMAFDSIFRGINEQWAYVSVMTPAAQNPEEAIRRIRSFITILHPLVVQ